MVIGIQWPILELWRFSCNDNERITALGYAMCQRSLPLICYELECDGGLGRYLLTVILWQVLISGMVETQWPWWYGGNVMSIESETCYLHANCVTSWLYDFHLMLRLFVWWSCLPTFNDLTDDGNSMICNITYDDSGTSSSNVLWSGANDLRETMTLMVWW